MRKTDFFTQLGIGELRIPLQATADPDYFTKQGFQRAHTDLTRALS